MGGLYGSEYWTYSLPKRVGVARAEQLTEQCLPISVHEARSIGLIDDIIIQDDLGNGSFGRFRDQIVRIAESLACSANFESLLSRKRAEREGDERVKPLEQYRREELAEMNRNFWGPDPSYHLARAAFVRKLPRPGHLKCAVALEKVCGNAPCDEAKRLAANRCAVASRGWVRHQPAA
jgi:putative two-component system hydrogenase maturation factor HypX/HoxX